jgi:hypothetical protein
MAENDPIKRPTKVPVAQAFLYTIFVVVALKVLIEALEPRTYSYEWVIAKIVLVNYSGAIFLLFTYKIGEAWIWGRPAASLYFVAWSCWIVYQSVQATHYSLFFITSSVVSLILWIVVLVLLYQPDMSAWFTLAQDASERQSTDDHQWVGFQEEQIKQSHSQDILKNLKQSAASDGMTLSEGSEPLFVLKYRVFGRVLRAIAAILVLVFLGLFLVVIPTIGEFGVLRYFMELVCFAATLVFLLSLAETMLFREIRLYKDRIVKVRHLIGNLEIVFKDAALIGGNTGFSDNRVFHKKGTDPNRIWWVSLRYLYYDELMAARKDVTKMNTLLAELTNRDIREFQQKQISLDPLIKEE